MKKLSLVIACLLLGSMSSVASAELSSVQLKAADFLLKQIEAPKKISIRESRPVCDEPAPIGAGCVGFVGGSYPSSDERLRAARACAGVRDLACVQYVAGSYPSFSERETAARQCSGVDDTACVEFVAGSYPSRSERDQAAASCKYASVDCVRQVAGSYPSFSQRVAAAKACGGQ